VTDGAGDHDVGALTGGQVLRGGREGGGGVGGPDQGLTFGESGDWGVDADVEVVNTSLALRTRRGVSDAAWLLAFCSGCSDASVTVCVT
jgi:hypothetical protein